MGRSSSSYKRARATAADRRSPSRATTLRCGATAARRARGAAPSAGTGRSRPRAWIAVVLLAKVLLGLVLWPFGRLLGHFGLWLFRPRRARHLEFELVVAMVIVPCVTNTVAFWIYDNILMHHHPAAAAAAPACGPGGGAGGRSAGKGKGGV